MINLLKCEFKKFKSTYINSLSMLGMLTPTALTFLMFLIKRQDFIKMHGFTWANFEQYITLMLILLVGPIITAFVATFSVFYEYQQKTMKNVLSAPYGRAGILTAKVVNVILTVTAQYLAAALISIGCGLVLGLDMTAANIIGCIKSFMAAGIATLSVVPLMMFLTLLSKNFILPMVITVVGTIANVIVMNWDKSYLSPFAIPTDLMMILQGKMPMDISLPLISLAVYMMVFMITSLVYFKNADQSV